MAGKAVMRYALVALLIAIPALVASPAQAESVEYTVEVQSVASCAEAQAAFPASVPIDCNVPLVETPGPAGAAAAVEAAANSNLNAFCLANPGKWYAYRFHMCHLD